MGNVLMNTSKFLIAKYVDNIKRMEPNNLGVLLWTPDGSDSKFLGESEPGILTQKPRFIKQKNYPVYCDWVTYWRKKVSKFGSKDLESFSHELIRSRGDNYIIVQGGFIPRKVDDVADATDQLFAELVSSPDAFGGKDEQPKVLLKKKCKTFFDETAISSNENFHENYRISGKILGVKNKIPFSFGIGIGGDDGLFKNTEALFEMTDLSNQKDWQSAITRFTSVRSGSKSIPRERCASMIDIPTDQLSGETLAVFKTMEKASLVINLSETEEALDLIGEMGLAL